MFKNIGKKIKVLAEVVCWIGIIASVLMGLFMMGQQVFLEGALLLIFGPLSSWISSWMLYAFGQLVENTDKLVGDADNINKNTIKINNKFKEA